MHRSTHFGSYKQSKLRGTRRKCRYSAGPVNLVGQDSSKRKYDFKFTSVYSEMLQI